MKAECYLQIRAAFKKAGYLTSSARHNEIRDCLDCSTMTLIGSTFIINSGYLLLVHLLKADGMRGWNNCAEVAGLMMCYDLNSGSIAGAHITDYFEERKEN